MTDRPTRPGRMKMLIQLMSDTWRLSWSTQTEANATPASSSSPYRRSIYLPPPPEPRRERSRGGASSALSQGSDTKCGSLRVCLRRMREASKQATRGPRGPGFVDEPIHKPTPAGPPSHFAPHASTHSSGLPGGRPGQKTRWLEKVQFRRIYAHSPHFRHEPDNGYPPAFNKRARSLADVSREALPEGIATPRQR